MPQKSFILTMTIYAYDIQALAILQAAISQKLKLHNLQYLSLSWNIFCSFTEKPRIIEKVACVFFFVENKVYFNYLPWSLIYILSRLEMPRLFFKLRLPILTWVRLFSLKTTMVFCFKNCYDLLCERIVLSIDFFLFQTFR